MKNWLNNVQGEVVFEESYEQEKQEKDKDKEKRPLQSPKTQKKSLQGSMDVQQHKFAQQQPQQQQQSQNTTHQNSNFQIKVDTIPKVIGLNIDLDDREQNFEKLLRDLNFPSEFPNYSSKEYWNTRYTHEKGQNNEWLQNYSSIRSYIHKSLQGKINTSSTLYIGCGNSKLGEEMALDGFSNIYCVDFSDVLISEISQRFHQYSSTQIQYEVMDVCEKLDFPNNSIDLVIDKGLMDSIVCDENSAEKVRKMLSECWRVLKAKGTLIVLSYGHPDTRVQYLKTKQQPFYLNIQELPKVQVPQFSQLDEMSQHYLYICTK